MKSQIEIKRVRSNMTLSEKALLRAKLMSQDKTIVKLTYSAIDDCLIIRR